MKNFSQSQALFSGSKKGATSQRMIEYQKHHIFQKHWHLIYKTIVHYWTIISKLMSHKVLSYCGSCKHWNDIFLSSIASLLHTKASNNARYEIYPLPRSIIAHKYCVFFVFIIRFFLFAFFQSGQLSFMFSIAFLSNHATNILQSCLLKIIVLVQATNGTKVTFVDVCHHSPIV